MQMKDVLIASYDMEVGGVERSLAGMLNAFDYSQHHVDVMLYRHQGDGLAAKAIAIIAGNSGVRNLPSVD